MKLAESYICLNNIRLHARHGIMPQERATGGEFVVSLRVEYPVTKAIESDDVADTVNYAEILEIINKEMLEPSCLLEHAAGRIARSIFTRMPETVSIFISLAKINPPVHGDIDSASVELHLINDKTI